MSGPTTAESGERQHADGGRPRRRSFAGLRRAPGSHLARSWRPLGRVRRRRLAVFLAGVVVLGGFCGWALYSSSWLRVEHVSVSGTRVLDPDEVRDVAAVGLGSPLVSVDTDAVAERLRRKLPRIDSVDVVRSWPHGIGLRVTERTPVLLIGKPGKFTEVDAKGVRFATVAKAPKGVPVLEWAVPSRGPAVAGLRRFGTDRLVAAAVGVVGSLPPAVARDAKVVKVRSYDSISVELTRGREVVWGSDEQGPEKGRTLTALMKAAPRARHFDVRAPSAPAVSGS